MGDNRVRYTITVDVTPLVEAFDAITAGLGRLAVEFARSLNRASRTVAPPASLRNWDRVTGWWQSDMCAAWLHGSCQYPDRCLCKCGHLTQRGELCG